MKFSVVCWFICFCAGLVSREKEYVTCSFCGQLGNQMFQIAAAIGYGLDHGMQPVFYQNNNLPNEEELKYVFHRFSFLRKHKKINFHNLQYDLIYTFSELPYIKGKNIRLNGFFQSEKYFSKYADIIRKIFEPSKEVVDQINEKYGQLLLHPTVAVHVRTFIPDNRCYDKNGIGNHTWEYFLKAMNSFLKIITF